MNQQLLRIILYNQKQSSASKQYDAAYRRHKCKDTVLASEAAILNCAEKNAITIWSKNLRVYFQDVSDEMFGQDLILDDSASGYRESGTA